MSAFIENIKKMTGWCPCVNSKIYKSNSPVEFESSSISPFNDKYSVQQVRSENITFPANTAITTIFISAGFFLLLNISRYLDYSVLAIAAAILYSLFYILGVKTYQASIHVDENGVQLKSFRLRDITLNFLDIRSVKSFKWETKKKTSFAIGGLLFTALTVILAVGIIEGHWRLIISTAPLFPVVFLLYMKEKARGYHNLNTQLYIEYRTKKWYELSPYYSVITDEITAAKISAGIEYYQRTGRDAS